MVPNPKAKSSSEIMNLTPFTIIYHLGDSPRIFRTRWEYSRALASVLSQYTHFLLYFANTMVCLREWKTHPAWSKWWILSVVSRCLMTEGSPPKGSLVGGLCWPANAKRHSTLLQGEWPEMDKAYGVNFPLSINFFWILWPFRKCLGN